MRRTHTTTYLKLPRARLDLPPAASAAIVVFCAIVIVALVGRIRNEHPAAVAVPTPSLPIVIFQKEPAPPPAPTALPIAAAPVRWVTAFAAPDGVVLGPIPEPAMSAITARWGDGWLATQWEGATVWVRVSELGGSLANLAPVPQVQPAVIYVEQPAYAPAYAAPTPEPEQYQVANEPNSIEARQALIGDDPNALACQNAEGVASPLCGGITNAEAQAALDRERNIQNRLVEPTQTLPAALATVTTDVQRSGGQLSDGWKQEHCINIDTEAEVCQ